MAPRGWSLAAVVLALALSGHAQALDLDADALLETQTGPHSVSLGPGGPPLGPGSAPTIHVGSPRAESDQEGGATVTDASGDAYVHGTHTVSEGGMHSCRAVMNLRPVCPVVGDTGEETPDVGFVPAPAAMDLTAVHVHSDAASVWMTLEIAALTESFEEAVTDQYTARYTVWFDELSAPECQTYASVMVELGADGAFYSYQETGRSYSACDTDPRPCNAWFWCASDVSVSFEYGAPGSIVFEIPRDRLHANHEGAILSQIGGSVERFTRADDGGATQAQVDTPAGDIAYSRSTSRLYYHNVDVAGPDGEHALMAPAAPSATPPSHTWTYQNAFGNDIAKPASIDIINTTVSDNETHVSFHYAMADVAAVPSADQFFWFALGLEDGHLVSGHYSRASDGTTSAAGAVYDTNGSFVDYVGVGAQVTPGTPGRVQIDLHRSELPTIPAGSVTSLLFLSTAEHVASSTEGMAPVGVGINRNTALDNTGVAPPYTFRLDAAPALALTTFSAEDAIGDARLPDLAATSGANAAQFDISGIDATLTNPGLTRLSLRIVDLGLFEVPAGYDAVYYAFGLEHDESATMVGYYRQGDEPRGDFFCASDNAVLPATPMDPTRAIWTIIEGFVQGADGLGGGGTPGELVFHVPHECFGATDRNNITFATMEAATFLVTNPSGQNGEGQLEEVDRATSGGPVTLLAASSATEEPSAPVPPFAPLWILLVLAAIGLLLAGGLLVVARQRSDDRRAALDAKASEDRSVYRTALGRAIAAETPGTGPLSDDPVLRALRGRLRISDRQHAIMEMTARQEAGASGFIRGTLFLGRYRIERELGRGGSARVLLATDETLVRRVVLKVARWPSPEVAMQALHEARILAQAPHQNIVAIHDAEVVGDETILVLAYQEGGSLADRLKAGPVSREEAKRIVDDVLAGLAAAHRKGILHRDVKPANILFGPDGVARVADFGIAVHEESDATVGSVDEMHRGAGTVRYMSPEQARDLPVDARSDLYSAAVVLYEALTGKSYLGLERLGSFEARQAIIQEPPRLRGRGIGKAMAGMLQVALAKDPEARYPDADAMRAALSEA